MEEVDYFADDDDDLLPDAAIAAILEDSDDDDDYVGNRRQRVFVDLEGWRRLEGVPFREHFRMSRELFQKLVVAVGSHMRDKNRLLRIRTPLDVALLMTLWILANPDTHRSTGSQFGVSKSVVFYHYSYCIEALRELSQRFIKWPGAAEREQIKTRFETRYGYPGVIGAIDGTHVQITAPLEQPQRYVNRHHKYSYLVQAVSDDKLLYRDVYIGQPGSVGDARMFERSPLSDNLLRVPQLLDDDEHLLGDGAYTLSSKILTPYANDGHMTQRQRTHNNYFSKCRASIEKSFALAKGKFRRLKHFPTYNVNIALDHMMASFVLHNFIILDGEDCQGLLGNGVHVEDPAVNIRDQARMDGAAKREYIARLLYPEDDFNG